MIQSMKSYFGAPGRIRTVDQLIKSQLLYRLSYGGFFLKTTFNILNKNSFTS